MLVLRYFLTSYPYCGLRFVVLLIFNAHWPEFKLVLQEDQWSPFSSPSKQQVFWWIIFLWHLFLWFLFLLFSWRMCRFFGSFINRWSCHLRINKALLAQRQIYRSMDQNRKPRDKSTNLWSPYLRQRRQGYTMEKR